MVERVRLLKLLQGVNSEIELAALLREAARQFDMSAFAIYDLPCANAVQLKPYVRLTDTPSRFYDNYDRYELLRDSPMFNHLRKSTTPKLWRADTLLRKRSETRNAHIRGVLAEMGFEDAAVIPVHKIDGTRGAVVFSGRGVNIRQYELGILGLIAVHAYDIFDLLNQAREALDKPLTARETEVLEWAANGKTSGEIAQILALSDHTINTYMNSAMRKLDCVNRTQLVAKALRLHLIN